MSDTRICFIGDSFVNGTGDPQMLGWAGRLCVQAQKTGHKVTYYNLGIRRHTSTDILQRWPEILLRQQADGDHRIVLSCGVNDTVIENDQQRVDFETSLQNIQQMLKQMQNCPGLVVGPPPVDNSLQNQRIQTLSQVMHQATESAGLPFISLFDDLVEDSDYLNEISQNDGAHPQADGYAKITQLILASGKWWF